MRLTTVPPAALAAAATAAGIRALSAGIPAGGGGAAGQGGPVSASGGAGACRPRPEIIQMALMLRYHDQVRSSPCFAPLPMPYKLDALSAMAESRMELASHGISSMLFLTPQCCSPQTALEEASLQRSLVAYFFGLQWFRGLPSERRDGILEAMVKAKLRISVLGINLMVVTVPNGLKDPRGIPLPLEALPLRGLDLGMIGVLEQRYDAERIQLMDESWMPEPERNQLAVARVIHGFILPEHNAVAAN